MSGVEFREYALNVLWYFELKVCVWLTLPYLSDKIKFVIFMSLCDHNFICLVISLKHHGDTCSRLVTAFTTYVDFSEMC